jgi:hypothetical protein
MDADAQTQQTTLEQFIASVEHTVSRGENPDPVSIIAQGETYPPIRDLFLKQPGIVAEWMSAPTSEDQLRAAKKFISYKKEIFESPVPGLKQFRHEQDAPTGPVSPIREKAIADARSGLIEHRKQKEGRNQSDYARKVTQNFIARLREQRLYGPPEEIEKAVNRELNKPVYATTDENVKTTLVENISQAPEFSQDRHAVKTIAENIFKEYPGYVKETKGNTASSIEAASVIISDPTIDTPTFIHTFTNGYEGNNAPVRDQIFSATRAARAAVVVNAPKVDAEGMRVGGILTLIPGVKEAAIERAFVNAWEKTVHAEKLIGTITTRFGEDAVRSETFKNIIKSGTDITQQKHAVGAIAGSLGKIAGDVLTSVQGPPSEDMINYISALYQKYKDGGAPELSPANYVVTMLYTRSPNSFSAGGTLSHWILSWGTNRVMGEAMKGLWTGVAKKFAGSALIKTIGGIIGAPLGGPVGVIGGSVLLDKIFSFGKKIFGGIKGWLEGRPSGGDLIPVPAFGVLFAVCIFAALGFLIVANFSEDNRTSALVTSYNVGGGTGEYEEGVLVTLVDCEKTPNDPLCRTEPCIPRSANDCRWPTSGRLTQGPYAHCVINGSQWSTHDKFNAIDIGAPYNSQVISVKAGEVVKWASGCPDNPGGGNSASFGCNGGWGNYVDISGGGYVLRYSHLAYQSMGLTHLHMQVAQGQVIGRVDNNGTSYGSHLHFGIVSGPGSIVSLLPLSETDRARVIGCGYDSRCPVVCPRVSVSTH